VNRAPVHVGRVDGACEVELGAAPLGCVDAVAITGRHRDRQKWLLFRVKISCANFDIGLGQMLAAVQQCLKGGAIFLSCSVIQNCGKCRNAECH
jgi:hypothetical protein